jgi:aminoglycoside phosphotransferase (APT) family kinase protein
VDREYRVITALGRTDVSVPRTYVLCEDDAVIGTAFYVMDYVHGRVFAGPALPEATPAERTSMCHGGRRGNIPKPADAKHLPGLLRRSGERRGKRTGQGGQPEAAAVHAGTMGGWLRTSTRDQSTCRCAMKMSWILPRSR